MNSRVKQTVHSRQHTVKERLCQAGMTEHSRQQTVKERLCQADRTLTSAEHLRVNAVREQSYQAAARGHLNRLATRKHTLRLEQISVSVHYEFHTW